jgi:mannose-6-phosphate isomerase-like protein (cupin superfamily)
VGRTKSKTARPGKKKKQKKYPPYNNNFQEFFSKKEPSHRPPESWFLRQFWPEFEELPVGLMGYSLILLFIFDPAFQQAISDSMNHDKAIYALITYLLVFWVILKSIFHVFSDRSKSIQDKKAMVGFAAFCCGATGIVGGARLTMIGSEGSWLHVLGLYNVLQGLFLALLIKFELIDENSFSDRETPFWGALTAFLAITTLFLFLRFQAEMHWIDNFSILVAFAMTFASPLCDLIYYRPKWLNRNTNGNNGILKIKKNTERGFTVPAIQWQDALKNAAFDKVAKIRHAELEGNPDWRKHVAEIQKKVACHVHFSGDEVYEVVAGAGTMYLGVVDREDSGDKISEKASVALNTGDTLVIPAGVAHQLVRSGKESLIIIFACADSHLAEDRRVLPDIDYPAISES